MIKTNDGSTHNKKWTVNNIFLFCFLFLSSFSCTNYFICHNDKEMTIPKTHIRWYTTYIMPKYDIFVNKIKTAAYANLYVQIHVVSVFLAP